jgi:hypothetical protein
MVGVLQNLQKKKKQQQIRWLRALGPIFPHGIDSPCTKSDSFSSRAAQRKELNFAFWTEIIAPHCPPELEVH